MTCSNAHSVKRVCPMIASTPSFGTHYAVISSSSLHVRATGSIAGVQSGARSTKSTGCPVNVETRRNVAAMLVLLAATIAYGLVVVQYFGGPLIGVDDANGMEHYSFLLEHQLTLGIPPRIDFAPTKEVLYPFGT